MAAASNGAGTAAGEAAQTRKSLRVGILGCGALGGVMAGRLAAEGDVALEVYNTNEAIAQAVARDGLVLVDGERRFATPVRLLPGPQGRGDGAAALDLVILATKSVGLVEAAGRLLPALGEHGVFVTIQNGLVARDLADAFGEERVIAGAVLWGASMDAPGVYRVTAHGPFVLGRLREAGVPFAAATSAAVPRPPAGARPPAAGAADAALERAAEVLGRLFPARVSDNMSGVLWSKLAITASLTTVGAITGLRFGELVRRRRIRKVLLGLGAEVLAVARCRAITFEPLGGGLNLERFLSPAGYPVPVKHLLMRMVGSRHRNTESSMLDSLRRGRRTEIAFINGRVVELGEASGIPCPLNRTAVELVQEMEAGRAAPSVDHLGRFTVG